MNDIVIESAGGFFISTEQWNGDLCIAIASSTDPADQYDGKSICLDLPRVRKLAEWLSVWVLKQEEKHGD